MCEQSPVCALCRFWDPRGSHMPYGFGYCERNSEQSFPSDDEEGEKIPDDARVLSLAWIGTRHDFGCVLWERGTQETADHWRVPWDDEISKAKESTDG